MKQTITENGNRFQFDVSEYDFEAEWFALSQRTTNVTCQGVRSPTLVPLYTTMPWGIFKVDPSTAQSIKERVLKLYEHMKHFQGFHKLVANIRDTDAVTFASTLKSYGFFFYMGQVTNLRSSLCNYTR